MGTLFTTSEIDSITFDRSTIKANTLNVAYAPNNTWVTVSADMAPHVAITLKGDHVSVMADADVAEEYTYALAGSSNNGSFYMDGQYKSTINLSALNLTNPDSAAICIDNGKRIKVELTNGNSTLADGTANPRKACFFINGHAEFSGNASLTLTGNANMLMPRTNIHSSKWMKVKVSLLIMQPTMVCTSINTSKWTAEASTSAAPQAMESM